VLRDRDVLIPFGAFEAFNIVRTIDNPNLTLDNCVLWLTSDVTVLQDAPYFEDGAWTDDLNLRDTNWHQQYRDFWSGVGVTFNQVDETAQMTAQPVLLRGGFDIDVRNLENDNLGEIVEFVVNEETGQMEYGILGRGGLLGIGASYYPIPMEQLMWVHFGERDDEFDIDDYGEFLLNVQEEQFDNAPALDDLDDLNVPVATWSGDIDAFWANLVPGAQPQQ
jgi:hypothetical protein